MGFVERVGRYEHPQYVSRDGDIIEGSGREDLVWRMIKQIECTNELGTMEVKLRGLAASIKRVYKEQGRDHSELSELNIRDLDNVDRYSIDMFEIESSHRLIRRVFGNLGVGDMDIPILLIIELDEHFEYRAAYKYEAWGLV